eukprot:PITA_05840
MSECVETETSSFEKAVQKPVWVDGMVEEYDSIVRNSVWDVVPKLEDESVVEGIDSDETFSPISRYSLIRSILALSTQMGWKIHQMDVKATFLIGKIEEEVYIEKLEDFETFDCDDKLIKSCKEDLAREFEMKDLGLMHYFLGMEVWQGDEEIFVSQGKYANKILKRFHLERNKPMETPLTGNWRKEDATSGEVVEATIYRKVAGSLMYLVNIRPNMCYEVNQLIQEMVRATKLYWKADMHVLRYIIGTTQYGLWYKQTEGLKLQGFIDAHWVGSPFDRKRTLGGIFNIGSAIVSWYNRKQRPIELSSTEAEGMATSQATCEAI